MDDFLFGVDFKVNIDLNHNESIIVSKNDTAIKELIALLTANVSRVSYILQKKICKLQKVNYKKFFFTK